MNNFDESFPHWKGRGCEIAGFVWWQGHKDGGEPYASRYEQNLVHFIKTLRKEFDAPETPFAIATIGFGGWEMAGPHKTVAEAQLAVSGDKGKYPEFQGNVLTVEIRDRSPARYLWATLIARLFEIFPLTCRHCGAEMKIIAFVIETPSVRAILEHIGEPTRPPVISPARATPPWEEDPIAVDLGYDPLAEPEPEFEFDQRIQW